MFVLNLVTPEAKLVLDQELEEVVVPTHTGEINVLPGHAPLFALMEPGVITYKLKGKEKVIMAVSWGYCEVFPGGVNVLVENAVLPNLVNTAVVTEHLSANQDKLYKEILSDHDFEQTVLEIKRLKAELDISSKH